MSYERSFLLKAGCMCIPRCIDTWDGEGQGAWPGPLGEPGGLVIHFRAYLHLTLPLFANLETEMILKLLLP